MSGSRVSSRRLLSPTHTGPTITSINISQPARNCLTSAGNAIYWIGYLPSLIAWQLPNKVYKAFQNNLIFRGFLSSTTPYSQLFDQTNGRILITGLDDAGKTTLL